MFNPNSDCDGSDIFNKNQSLLPVGQFMLSEEEIRAYYPDINPDELEILQRDLLVISEILYHYERRTII